MVPERQEGSLGPREGPLLVEVWSWRAAGTGVSGEEGHAPAADVLEARGGGFREWAGCGVIGFRHSAQQDVGSSQLKKTRRDEESRPFVSSTLQGPLMLGTSSVSGALPVVSASRIPARQGHCSHLKAGSPRLREVTCPMLHSFV